MDKKNSANNENKKRYKDDISSDISISESNSADGSADLSDADTVNPDRESASSSCDAGSDIKNVSDAQAADTENTDSEIGTDRDDDTPEKTGIADKFRIGVRRILNVAEVIEKNRILARFIGLFFIFSSAMLIINYRKDPKMRFYGDWGEFSKSVDLKIMIISIGAVFVILCLLNLFVKKLREVNFDSYLFVFGTMLFGISTLWRTDEYFYGIGTIVISVVLLSSFTKPEDFKALSRVPKAAYMIIVLALAGGMTAFILVTTIAHHKGFGTSTYDMGIFVQMYHSMITNLSQLTTCERGKELSHFAVHCSPIFYMLLPFYYIAPKPETLLAAQGILVMSGIVPFWMICRKYKLSPLMSMLLSLSYIFSVMLISPCYYDFHENAFLPPLIMWFMYAAEKDKHILMYIMMLLVLMVKEDSALYVMCIGLYFLFSGKKKRHGFIIFDLAVLYFVIVTSLMGKYGEGVMTSRTFGNIMMDHEGSFGEVLKAVITNPAYVISECFKEDKLMFIAKVLLPLMFLPLITKKASHLMMVVPFLVINMASGYPYCSDIGYQYIFGSASCLLYISVVNAADLDRKIADRLIPLAAAASLFTFTCIDTGKLYHLEMYKKYKDEHDRMEMYLSMIPEDASLMCTTWMLPHAANRKTVNYLDQGNAPEPSTSDFVAINMRYKDEWKLEKIDSLLNKEGYTLYTGDEDIVQIFVSPEYERK